MLTYLRNEGTQEEKVMKKKFGGSLEVRRDQSFDFL